MMALSFTLSNADGAVTLIAFSTGGAGARSLARVETDADTKSLTLLISMGIGFNHDGVRLARPRRATDDFGGRR